MPTGLVMHITESGRTHMLYALRKGSRACNAANAAARTWRGARVGTSIGTSTANPISTTSSKMVTTIVVPMSLGWVPGGVLDMKPTFRRHLSLFQCRRSRPRKESVDNSSTFS